MIKKLDHSHNTICINVVVKQANIIQPKWNNKTETAKTKGVPKFTIDCNISDQKRFTMKLGGEVLLGRGFLYFWFL